MANDVFSVLAPTSNATAVINPTSNTTAVVQPEAKVTVVLGNGYVSAGSGGMPGGSNTQVQFNNNGVFGGSPGLTWDGAILGTDTIGSLGTAALSLRSPTAIRIGDNFANFISMTGNGASLLPSISSQGVDANINLVLYGKGTGGLQIGTLANATPIIAVDSPTPTTLTPGTAGQVLTSSGPNKTPYWSALTASAVSVNGAVVSNPNLQNNALSLGVDWSVSGSNITGALRLTDVQTVANTQIGLNIGSVGSAPTPSLPFAQLGGSVVSDDSNWVLAAVNIAASSYATARAALIALGATPNASAAGGLWVLPQAPLYVTNIASPSASQYGRIASIDEGVSSSLLIINMVDAVSYLDSLPSGAQPIFISSAAFTFQNAPAAAIRLLAQNAVPPAPLLLNIGQAYNADNVGLLWRIVSSTPAISNAAGQINNINDYGAVTITSTPFPPTIPTGFNRNFIGISDDTNTLWAGIGRLTVSGIDQIAWIKKPTSDSNFTNARLWVGVNEIASVYSAINLDTAQTVAGPVTSIITPEATHVYADDGLGGTADTVTFLPFIQANAVTSLNGVQGVTNLISSDSSVAISPSIANKTINLTTAVPNVAGTATARNNGPVVLSNVTKTYVGANAALYSSDKGVSFQVQPLTAYSDTPQALSVGTGYGFGYNAQTSVEWDAPSSLVLRSAISGGAQTANVPGNALATFVLSSGPTFDVTGGFPGVEADTYPGFNTANIYDRLAPRVPVTQGSGLLAPGVGQLQAWYSDGSVGGFGFAISGTLTFTSGTATLNFTNAGSLVLGTSGVTRISIWNPLDGSVGLQSALSVDVASQFFNVTSWLPSGGEPTTGITLGSNGLQDGTYTIKSGAVLIFWKAWPASIPANTLSYANGGYIDVAVGQNLWSANSITYFPNVSDQTGVLATTFSGSLTGNTLSVPTNGVDTSGRTAYLKTGMTFVNAGITYTIIGYPVTPDGNRAAYIPAGSGPFAYTVSPSLASGTATLTNTVATAPNYNLTWFANIGNVIHAGLTLDLTRSYLLPQYSNWDNHVTLQYSASPSIPNLQQVTTKGNSTNQNIVFNDTQATPGGVTIGAPSAVTTSYALKLPPAQATSSGQALTNDGTGNLSWSASASGTTVYSTIPYKTSGGGQGFTYIDFVSLLGTDLPTAASFFPLNSQFTINRFFGTSTRPVLTVTGAVTSPSANNYRVPCSGLGTFDIYTGDAAIIIRENSFLLIDEPLLWQPSNSKVGLEFDNTLALSSTSGVLQIAPQGAAAGQNLTFNGTSWTPYLSWGQLSITLRYNTGVTPTTGVSATFTNPVATVTGTVHYYLRYSTTTTPSTSSPVYRFVPDTDGSLTALSYDSFWTTFSGGTLSGLMAQRGYF